MKRLYKAIIALALVSALLVGAKSLSDRSQEATFVILSTNDMHAQITKFPALASAIELCRDTTDVILVDAGDRWTGNAFVDLVDHYNPIYELLNHLKYDVTIYGNHEFDKGQAYLAAANRQASFPIICANVVSDTTSFPQPRPMQIVKVRGKRIAFVGVVGNYEAGGHPSGKGESYAGIRFSDPHTTAGEYGYLADECDMVVLVSHSGLEPDMVFAASPLSQGYDQIISAHSHDEANEVIGGKLVTQTGSRLKNIGATTVTISKDGEVTLSYRNVPLADYTPDTQVAAMVEKYLNNPELNAPVGSAAAPFDEAAMRNLFASTIKQRSGSDIGLYHAGGVRIDTLTVGNVSMADILNAEPFSSCITVCQMTPAQIEELIVAKFNDTVNVGESHYVDIITTTPYTILTDQKGDAVQVLFPELKASSTYSVAMGDYIFKTYRGLNYKSGQITETLITEALKELFEAGAPVAPDSEVRQQIAQQ